MSLLPDLDDELQAKILTYVTEPRASRCCKYWKDALYKTLHLKDHASFNRQLFEEGKVVFCYNAVRPLGVDFEESVGYNFMFAPDRTYRMQWTRTFDAWSSQSEQQFGKWNVLLDEIACETLEPLEQAGDREVRYAPAGYKFRIPVKDILVAEGRYYTVPDGSPAETWEMPARNGKYEAATSVNCSWSRVEEVTAPPPPVRLDARFVEVDGDMVEVSGDIVENWPEHDWERLMRCRLRFGIIG
jgi:hypothetical protein